MISARLSFFLMSAFCAASIVIALFLQYYLDMEPCPLCITQRIFIIAVGIATLLAGILYRVKLAPQTLSVIAIIFALIGGGVSARHVWIQNLPEDEVPICGPGLAYMFETRPIFDAMGVLFAGDGHCADVNLSILGLSIPGWTLVSFIALTLIPVWLLWRIHRQGD